MPDSAGPTLRAASEPRVRWGCRPSRAAPRYWSGGAGRQSGSLGEYRPRRLGAERLTASLRSLLSGEESRKWDGTIPVGLLEERSLTATLRSLLSEEQHAR